MSWTDYGGPNDVTRDAFRQLVLEKVRLRWGHRVSVAFVNDWPGGPAELADLVVDEVSMVFERQLAAKHEWADESGWVMVPATWWDHFKADVFPAWLLRRFPPREESITIERHAYRVCPHIDVPKGCVKWLGGLDG